MENLYNLDKNTTAAEMYNKVENAIMNAAKQISNKSEEDSYKFTRETKRLMTERIKLDKIKQKTATQKIQLAEPRKLEKKINKERH